MHLFKKKRKKKIGQKEKRKEKTVRSIKLNMSQRAIPV